MKENCTQKSHQHKIVPQTHNTAYTLCTKYTNTEETYTSDIQASGAYKTKIVAADITIYNVLTAYFTKEDWINNTELDVNAMPI